MGVIMSSDAMTPESRATARSGTFWAARVRTIARHVRSYPPAISERYGGGASGEMYRPAHPAAPRTTTRTPTLPRVMVDPTVGLDEPHDALLVEVVERVEPRPRRE